MAPKYTDQEGHHSHPASHKLLWSAALTTASITLAPYLLPAIGIGTNETLIEAENLLHINNVYGSGLAGGINQILSSVPLIGAALATGTITPILASAVIGLGGVLAANWLAKRESPGDIEWSKLLRLAAITTSALIALPSILTGISTGLSYIGLAASDSGSMAQSMYNSLGTSASHSTASSLFGAVIPHLLLCGISILPVGLAAWMGMSKGTPDTHITPGQGPDAHERLLPRSATEIYSAL